MNKLDRVANQWTSGRFLLTQAAAACLMLMTVTDCYVAAKIIKTALSLNLDLSTLNIAHSMPFDVGQIFIVTVMVFQNYFHKPNGEEHKADGYAGMNKPPVQTLKDK